MTDKSREQIRDEALASAYRDSPAVDDLLARADRDQARTQEERRLTSRERLAAGYARNAKAAAERLAARKGGAA